MAEITDMDWAGGISGAASAINMISNASTLFQTQNALLPRAILFVPKNTSMSLKEAMNLANINNDVMALCTLVMGRKSSGAAAAAASVGAKQVMGNADLQTQQVKLKANYVNIAAAMGTQDFVAMEVQYNPASIRFSNTTGAVINQNAVGDMGVMAGQTMSDGTRSALSVQLVFDDENIIDAFLNEGRNFTVEAAEDYAEYLVRMASGGYSVQTPCEGLLALLHFRKLRQVVFFWSEMFFHGDIDNVTVRYTMFNKLGHPIRATVDLLIRQGDNNDMYASDALAWQEAYRNLFKESLF